jgi:nicotinate phosphoribosyltransferase
MDEPTSALLTDLYQLNMMQAYLDHGDTGTAVFEFFMRKLPARRGFLMAAGLEQALDYLENLRFSSAEIDWLAQTGRFGKELLEQLARFRFTGDVHAMAEGTIFFADEPILRVTAPLPQGQLAETRLINILHFQSLVASKAARMLLIAADKVLVDFGLRRAHGGEAGLMAARASYLTGFAGTATVLAGERYGIPIFGTMAHSFIQAYDDEAVAFENFARSRPDNLTLLIDTYDTLAAARKVVALAPRLKADGITINAVRIDSGDLVESSKAVRRIFDDGGLVGVSIFASGGLDEDSIAELLRAGAPIDGFGVGASLTASSDVPVLDCAYKLQEYAGLARRKQSVGKVTWPGRKQVWRRYGTDGRMASDLISLESDKEDGEPLIQLVMQGGRRIAPCPPLADIRVRAARDLERLPEDLRRLRQGASYPVEVAPSLVRLGAEVDSRLARQEGAPS